MSGTAIPGSTPIRSSARCWTTRMAASWMWSWRVSRPVSQAYHRQQRDPDHDADRYASGGQRPHPRLRTPLQALSAAAYSSPAMLVRRIEPMGGTCRVRVRVKPRFNYGAEAPRTTRGSNHIRFWSDDLIVRLTTDGPVTFIAEEVWFVLDHPVNLITGAGRDHRGLCPPMLSPGNFWSAPRIIGWTGFAISRSRSSGRRR